MDQDLLDFCRFVENGTPRKFFAPWQLEECISKNFLKKDHVQLTPKSSKVAYPSHFESTMSKFLMEQSKVLLSVNEEASTQIHQGDTKIVEFKNDAKMRESDQNPNLYIELYERHKESSNQHYFKSSSLKLNQDGYAPFLCHGLNEYLDPLKTLVTKNIDRSYILHSDIVHKIIALASNKENHINVYVSDTSVALLVPVSVVKDLIASHSQKCPGSIFEEGSFKTSEMVRDLVGQEKIEKLQKTFAFQLGMDVEQLRYAEARVDGKSVFTEKLNFPPILGSTYDKKEEVEMEISTLLKTFSYACEPPIITFNKKPREVKVEDYVCSF